MGLITQNRKMKKSGVKVYNFTIPAIFTCPMAGECLKGCYARQGAFIWGNVAAKHKRNFFDTLEDYFVDAVIYELRKNKVQRLRIHDAGDFYDKERAEQLAGHALDIEDDTYLSKWVEIAKRCPDVEFYAYTKMVELFKQYGPLPSNMKIIFSFGGKQDHLIDIENDRHSQVFGFVEDLNEQGYIDASDDDSLALTENKKVGLVYHGAKSRKWGV